jgi:ABC-type sugar transport system substrate-binding protein
MLVANYSTTTEVLANALQDGEVAAIVSFPFRQSGVMAADALAEKLSGQPVQDTYSLEPVVYTQASFSDPVQSTDLQPPSC